MSPTNASLLRRDVNSDADAASSTSGSLSNVALGGLIFAAVAILALAVWLSIVVVKRRRNKKNEIPAISQIRASLDGEDKEKQELIESDLLGRKPDTENLFSRARLTASIIFPSKVLIRDKPSDTDVPSPDQETNRPFAPFSFALRSSVSKFPGSRPTSSRPISASTSFLSIHSSSSQRNSLASIYSFYTNPAKNPSPDMNGELRIQQPFSPTFLDELSVWPGQRVTLIQSYDDGWCIVSRVTFGQTEYGAIPIWCLTKAVKGVKNERPMRTSSVDKTVNVNVEAENKD